MLTRRRRRRLGRRDAPKRAKYAHSTPWLGLDSELWDIIFRLVPPIYLPIVRMTCRTFNDYITSMIDPGPKIEIVGDQQSVSDFILEDTSISFLQWIITQGCRWYPYTTHATDGNNCCIHNEKGCVYEEESPLESEYGQKIACAAAARVARFEVLQWLCTNGCSADSFSYTAAAMHGRLNIIEWLYAQGVKYNYLTPTTAARFGHLHVVQWSWGLSDKSIKAECLAMAKSRGYDAMVRWIESVLEKEFSE